MGMGGSADVASNAVMAKQADGGKREIKPAWTKIYGKTVDVSKFRHPGGNIIELFYGMDATTAFEAFHGHHKGAFKMLRSLPVKEVDPADIPSQPEEHVAEMSRLFASWRERGLFKPRPLVSGLYGMTVVALILTSVAFSSVAPALCGLLVGTCWAHCGFLQHMGGHRELGKVSLLWQHFFEGLCKGGSASWWRNRHNKHHAKTNVIGEDGDLRTTPFFAWDPTLAKKVPDWSLKTQAFTFLPALGAYVFVFAFTTRKYAVVKRLWHEVALMVAHYALFLYGSRVLAGATWAQLATYYCVGYAWQGVYLGFFFGLSHFAVERVPSTSTWLESSMIGTLDWGGASAFLGYASGFLNIQIEHHMAPQMPMENLRQIRADCKASALKFGLPYRELTFVAAAKLMMGGLYRTGREELQLRSDRQKFTRTQAVMGAAGAVIECVKAD